MFSRSPSMNSRKVLIPTNSYVAKTLYRLHKIEISSLEIFQWILATSRWLLELFQWILELSRVRSRSVWDNCVNAWTVSQKIYERVCLRNSVQAVWNWKFHSRCLPLNSNNFSGISRHVCINSRTAANDVQRDLSDFPKGLTGFEKDKLWTRMASKHCTGSRKFKLSF